MNKVDIKDLTGKLLIKQNFFRQWARVMREKSSLEMVREKALYDSHPLEYMRINATLAQFEEFVDFYGIKEGDGMYITPEDRLEIW